MSKIVKKKDLDVLIESTLEKAGLSIKSEKTKVVAESVKTKKEIITESKEVINEDLQRDLARFNKLSNYTYKK
jgi:hypothetical protein